MGYFDDFELLNIQKVVSMGGDNITPPYTLYHYLGVMTGHIMLPKSNGDLYCSDSPFVYHTPMNIKRLGGWQTPPGLERHNFYLEFRGKRADRIMRHLKTDFMTTTSRRMLFVDSPQPYISILEEIREIFNCGQDHRNFRITLLVEEFVALMYEQQLRNAMAGDRHRAGFEQLMAEINSDPGESYDFQDIARAWDMSYDHFRKLFLKYSGKPPHEFILAARLRLALKLLSENKIVAIKSIAEECGFSGASEFTRFFRKKIGVTPSRYQCLQRTM